MAVILINFSINTQKRALSDGEIHVYVWMNAQHNKIDKTHIVGCVGYLAMHLKNDEQSGSIIMQFP